MAKKIRISYDILSMRAIETESGINIDEAIRRKNQEIAEINESLVNIESSIQTSIDQATSGKMDKSQSADFYPMASNPSGYLVGSDLNGYATENWVENYTSAFITSGDIPHFTQEQADWNQNDSAAVDYIKNKPTIPSLDGYATETYVQNYTSGFITSADLPDLTDYATKQYVENNFYSASNPSGFITTADLPDMSDMATKTWVTDQNYITSADIPPIPEDVVTSSELATVSGEIVNMIPSLQGYATEQYVTDHTSAFITSADLPDVSDMATKTWVGEQGYLTSIPSEYITETELESAISGKADTSAIPDVSNFVTQEDIDRSVSGKMDSSETSAFYPMSTNPSGYLISSDLNGYATKTYVQNYTSAFITSADVPSGVQYSAGENIDISGNVISVTNKSQLLPGQNIAITPSGNDFIISSTVSDVEYSAGRYVSIVDHVIGVSGLQPSGAYLTSADLNGYATEQYVTDHTSAFITSSYLNDYAKTSALNDLSDTLTDFTDEFTADVEVLSGAIDDTNDALGDLSTALNDKLDKSESANYYPRYSNPEEYLTSADLGEYATTQDLQSGLSGKLDNAYSANFYPMATNPSGYITSGQVAQSDWTEQSSASPAYIKNKPTHMSLIGGNGIDISEVDSAIVISVSANYAMASDIAYVSGAVERAFDDTEQYVQSATSGKVDKIAGYGLSKNDFTDAYLDKLNSIASGAEVNVQSDWNVTNSALDSYIANKPEILNLIGRNGIEVSATSSSVIVSVSASYATTQDLSGKLDKSASADFYPMDTNPSGYITSGQIQQADWNEADSGALDYIKNKPSIIISQDSPAALGGISAPKYLMVVTSMPAAADIDPDTIYLVQGTYIGT